MGVDLEFHGLEAGQVEFRQVCTGHEFFGLGIAAQRWQGFGFGVHGGQVNLGLIDKGLSLDVIVQNISGVAKGCG